MTDKVKIATVSLAGCFGCHMSILDIDEKIIDLVELVEFDRSPLTDIKRVSYCDIGIIEGAVANGENVEILRDFRKHCKTLVAIGACALNGGIPAMRNHFSLKECLLESYADGMGLENLCIPNDPELPMLLNKVLPVQQVVEIDYVLPGCPPPADMIWKFFTALLEGREPEFSAQEIRYD
ncbi:MAG: NADP oxidoreductase [Gammaproteobacteria bacterium]|jgi:NAD-reducing hydrogenase small subunit|nr:NADP oxidoreductase [Gammaproteobacteria bacterium]MBT3721807.1 NADP oxidoreductase [Gammaproteobacteria bacterium]MBT4077558.1 NADP oxidoreductase [Gammaproteobacteria bacterium]MBT4195815.1 NADP oxidoreductase [Gammaproteobacteria bacterium]MBT4450069.1 NADP oxidoreductase [Gammaproteobacteria bacterium]